ncbi:MAG TPA: histidine phosphatase family protein [Steroidobacteraceae bacterium]|nr:histidine phosphatase family protein [Steroidobacteraceae bacterium]
MPYLYVVRHGQPDFTGEYDSITELGAQQSRWLGEHFAMRGLRFARVASGTLRRQAATCDLILQQIAHAPEPVRDPRYNEYDHASLLRFFAGRDPAALRASGDRRVYFTAIRQALQQWAHHEGSLSRGGETWADFGGRILGGVADLCAGLERDDNVLIVTSGGVIGRYVALSIGADSEVAIQLNLQTRNTGVTEIVRTPTGGTRLVAFNAVPHLEHPARSDAVTFS